MLRGGPVDGGEQWKGRDTVVAEGGGWAKGALAAAVMRLRCNTKATDGVVCRLDVV